MSNLNQPSPEHGPEPLPTFQTLQPFPATACDPLRRPQTVAGRTAPGCRGLPAPAARTARPAVAGTAVPAYTSLQHNAEARRRGAPFAFRFVPFRSSSGRPPRRPSFPARRSRCSRGAAPVPRGQRPSRAPLALRAVCVLPLHVSARPLPPCRFRFNGRPPTPTEDYLLT